VTTDALGGQIKVLFHNAPVPLPHLKSGALRGIAISSAKRSAAAPDPTHADYRQINSRATPAVSLLTPQRL